MPTHQPTAPIGYLRSCFLLLLPALLWNAALTTRLPADFFNEINAPRGIEWGETLGRILTFGLPMLMPLHLRTRGQKRALKGFVAGNVIYFASWLPLILFPQSEFAQSVWGFIAPAITPVFYLVPLAFVGRRFFFPVRYDPRAYLLVVSLFLVCHVTNVLILFAAR